MGKNIRDHRRSAKARRKGAASLKQNFKKARGAVKRTERTERRERREGADDTLHGVTDQSTTDTVVIPSQNEPLKKQWKPGDTVHGMSTGDTVVIHAPQKAGVHTDHRSDQNISIHAKDLLKSRDYNKTLELLGPIILEGLTPQGNLDPVLLSQAITAANKSGNLALAENFAAHGLRLFPDDPVLLRQSIEVSLAQRDQSTAKIRLELLSRLIDTKSRAFKNLQQSYFNILQGRPPRSHAFKQAHGVIKNKEKFPQLMEIFDLRDQVRMLIGKSDYARAHTKILPHIALLSSAPEKVDALLLAQAIKCARNLDNFDLAHTYLELGIARFPKHPWILGQAVMLCLADKDFDNAIHFLELKERVDPKSSITGALRVMCENQLTRSTDIHDHLRYAEDIDILAIDYE